MTLEDKVATVTNLSHSYYQITRGNPRPCKNSGSQICAESTVYNTPETARRASDKILEVIEIFLEEIKEDRDYYKED